MSELVAELVALDQVEDAGDAREDVRLDLLGRRGDRACAAESRRRHVRARPRGDRRQRRARLDRARHRQPARQRGQVEPARTARSRSASATARWPSATTGPGIDEDDLPYVFDRFYRASSARGQPGSGLGLAIVRQVAEAHGGQVTAERPDGGGTLVRLRLPPARRGLAARVAVRPAARYHAVPDKAVSAGVALRGDRSSCYSYRSRRCTADLLSSCR